ncbi:MAG: class I SAM-dependent methyltransferase [Actinobacteria bacterium]|nr:class I SAM-dependent methyltransferase [Actinomycetota bacterium]MDA2976507.1 class I SAM-dependent methyltransferase [Actinomycetota bacterium]MDA2985590.1 class I SAM-dependent methyltransferase [Actinomycetota bacterium]
MTRADLGKDPSSVSAMFDEVASAYDKTNDLLSLYQSRLWRRSLKAAVAPKSGERILDIAAGTGTSSMALRVPGAEVVAADFSQGMIAEGKKRYPDLEFVFADAMKLPFKKPEFHAVTMSFGLRNVQDHKVALGEFHRVLLPGGRLVICEFSRVRGLFGTLYRWYLRNVLPIVARLLSKNPEAYSYLADSIEAWPSQDELAQDIRDAGFSDVSYRNLTFGIVAIHTGFRN